MNRSPRDVYAYWRRLENVPCFMPHLKAVIETGQRTSHWTVSALGTTVEWEAEIVERGELDPRFVITHRLSLDDGPEAYAMFTKKEHECIKVVLRP